MPISDVLIATYPRSTITQNGMLDRVRGDVGLRGSNYMTDADIIAWANERSDEIGQRFRWYRTSSSINVTALTKEYPLPTGTIAIEEAWHNSLPLVRMQMADYQRGDSYWRTQNTGTPIQYYIRGNSGIGLQPTPGTTLANGLFLVCTALPPHPASGTDFYTVPYGGERAIVSGAKLRAAAKDSSGEGARRYEMILREDTENMLMLQRAIESVSEGEATVVGIDADSSLGSWWGFDPYSVSTAPP